MPRLLEKPLHIVASYQRKLDLIASLQNPFTKIMTLDDFISYSSAKVFNSYIADRVVLSCVLKKSLEVLNLKYFDYLIDSHNSIDLIVDFFIELKLNGVSLDSFNYTADKKNELSLIFNGYKQALKADAIADNADTAIAVYTSLAQGDELLREFSHVQIDECIDTDTFTLLGSAYYKKIYEILCQKGQVIQIETPGAAARLYRITNQIFDSCDEMRAAVKTAKYLMLQGTKEDDILIVTPKIQDHILHYYRMLDEYSMKGGASVGTPLSYYASQISKIYDLQKRGDNDLKLTKILNSWQSFKQHCASVKRLLDYKKIPYNNDDIDTKILQNSKIPPFERGGIRLTEPNQLTASNRIIKHIILAGADINSFPSGRGENFLYSSEQSESLFHKNNPYQTSLFHYSKLKAIAGNLYFINASHAGNAGNYPSTILEQGESLEFDFSQIDNKHDIIFKGMVDSSITLNDEFLAALESEQLTPYHAKLKNHDAVEKYSASKLNTYAQCPLKFYFNYMLKLKAPRDQEEGFTAMERGSLLHACFEKYVIAVQNDEVRIDETVTSAMREKMLQILEQEFSRFAAELEITQINVHHRVICNEISLGLNGTADKAQTKTGELHNFLQYLSDEFSHESAFENSLCEYKFYLDKEFNECDEDAAYISGKIDRLDYAQSRISIVDYKSKSMNVLDKIENLQDYQLPLYMCYARNKFKDALTYEAFLLSFRRDKESFYQKGSTVKTGEIEKKENAFQYTDEFEEKIIQSIQKIDRAVTDGVFPFNCSDSVLCEWCDFKHICPKDIMYQFAPEDIEADDTELDAEEVQA